MPATPEQEYQAVIEAQRTHLHSLQEQFNKKCAAAKEEAQTKLKSVGPQDKEAQQKILEEQKQKLQSALAELKTAIRDSTRDTMKKLEGVIKKKEEMELASIEQQIQSLKI